MLNKTFKFVSHNVAERERAAKREAEKKSEKNRADIDYIAMMTDVELDTEGGQEGTDNE